MEGWSTEFVTLPPCGFLSLINIPPFCRTMGHAIGIRHLEGFSFSYIDKRPRPLQNGGEEVECLEAISAGISMSWLTIGWSAVALFGGGWLLLQILKKSLGK